MCMLTLMFNYIEYRNSETCFFYSKIPGLKSPVLKTIPYPIS